MNKPTPSHNKLRWLSFTKRDVLIEVLAGLAIVSGFLIELSHIVHSQWERFFFNNSDFLTLPLVQQSLALKEPFHWVFSSQIFLFPEAIIYTLSALLTPNFRDALILNALFNCLLLYALLRFIATKFSATKQLARFYALITSLLVVFLGCLESRSTPSFATYFLVTTSYYGVVLASLASIGLIVTFLQRTSQGRSQLSQKQKILILASLLSIALLTSLSNPLFVLQFLIPLFIVGCLAFILNIVPWKTFLLVVGAPVFGSVVGIALRKLFLQNYFSTLGGVNNYLHFRAAGQALRTIVDTVLIMKGGGWQQKLELTLIIVPLLFAILTFLAIVHFITKTSYKKGQNPLVSPATFFMTGLVSVAPPLIIVGVIVTGNPQTRYLLPVIIFPLLAVLPLIGLKIFSTISARRLINLCFVALILVTLGIALFTNPVNSVRLASNYYSSDEQCLDSKLGHINNLVGVAQYWRARGLQLNSKANIKVLQVFGSLNRFTWLYNSADYKLYNPSFVIVDKPIPQFADPEVSLASNFAVFGDVVTAALGPPSTIYDCPSFEIYLYPVTNPGNAILNQQLRDPKLGL